MDERHLPLTVPTELERVDSFIEGSLLFTTIPVTFWCWQYGEFWWALPFVPFVALWTLTGEAACDWQGIGPIASGLRNLLGLRRAHEWVLAWCHYTSASTVPDFRAWWASSPSVPVAPKYPRISIA